MVGKVVTKLMSAVEIAAWHVGVDGSVAHGWPGASSPSISGVGLAERSPAMRPIIPPAAPSAPIFRQHPDGHRGSVLLQA